MMKSNLRGEKNMLVIVLLVIVIACVPVFYYINAMKKLDELYIYLMRKNAYNSNNDKAKYDDGLNSQQEDNGPIQHL